MSKSNIGLLKNKWLSEILHCFPIYVFLLQVCVQLVLAVSNPLSFDNRELILYFVWLPVFYLPFYLSKLKVFYYTITSLLGLNLFANLLHIIITSRPFTASSFFIFINSNADEMVEFGDTVNFMRILYVLPFVYLFYRSMKNVPQPLNTKNSKTAFGFSLLFSIIFIGENVINDRFFRKGVNGDIRVWTTIYSDFKGFKSNIGRTVKSVPSSLKDSTTQEIVVLVIGESLNRNHMGLYGYHRNTSPLLSQRNDITVYADIIAPYTNTLRSVMTMISNSNLDNPETPEEAINLIDIFSSAGYATSWISNQSPIGIWDNAIFNIANTAGKIYFVNQTANSSEESVNKISYDERVFTPFQSVLNNNLPQFIVVHLFGSHSRYAYRYPDKFNIFSDAKNERERTINEYDNSVLYNDFIVDSLMKILIVKATQQKVNATLVYLADHGENVYDEDGELGHNYKHIIPKCLIEVPYIVWTNQDDLKSKFQAAAAKPAISDDLFHYIIGLSNVVSPLYESARDINNPAFNTLRPRILEDNVDYKDK